MTNPKPTGGRNYEYDRQRNKRHTYGEPETTKTGKVIRTDHLEKLLRVSWSDRKLSQEY